LGSGAEYDCGDDAEGFAVCLLHVGSFFYLGESLPLAPARSRGLPLPFPLGAPPLRPWVEKLELS
jgi:hypothetical protein